jgi:hypothetical protein
MINKILSFISDNIFDYNEIHISYELSNFLLENKVINKIDNNCEQNIIGNTYIGNILINNKTIDVFYHILYEIDDIEFKI